MAKLVKAVAELTCCSDFSPINVEGEPAPCTRPFLTSMLGWQGVHTLMSCVCICACYGCRCYYYTTKLCKFKNTFLGGKKRLKELGTAYNCNTNILHTECVLTWWHCDCHLLYLWWWSAKTVIWLIFIWRFFLELKYWGGRNGIAWWRNSERKDFCAGPGLCYQWSGEFRIRLVRLRNLERSACQGGGCLKPPETPLFRYRN